MSKRRIRVEVDGKEYRCTSSDPKDHQGKTCPIHEDEDSPAYAPMLGRQDWYPTPVSLADQEEDEAAWSA